MNVFTYGSLMFPPVWHRVVRGDYAFAEATVHGFERMCVQGAAHPAMVISPRAAQVTGRLYFDVLEADIARLDHFETTNYARVTIAATIGTRAVLAQSYIALNLQSLSDKRWDVRHFAEHGLPRFLETYVAEHSPLD